MVAEVQGAGGGLHKGSVGEGSGWIQGLCCRWSLPVFLRGKWAEGEGQSSTAGTAGCMGCGALTEIGDCERSRASSWFGGFSSEEGAGT